MRGLCGALPVQYARSVSDGGAMPAAQPPSPRLGVADLAPRCRISAQTNGCGHGWPELAPDGVIELVDLELDTTWPEDVDDGAGAREFESHRARHVVPGQDPFLSTS
jgi:hypothetical protein